ncbi:MAG: TonB-dependent receptor [Bacteroidia bacterium]|nr:TonB-dependent receptor [Bacteroidia bacterium]
MRQLAIITLFLISSMGLFGQTQTIKGRVTILGLGIPANGGIVLVKDTKMGSYVDSVGNYRIENVPVGRVELVCYYFGDTTYSEGAQILTTAKALIYDFEVKDFQVEGGSNTVSLDPLLPVNDANPLANSFKIEDVQRAPSAVNDPSRYAMTLPGVQPVRDDNADIIIRGNAPTGLLWRLEGIDIPNPNHFARKGNTGGGISMFSAQLLGKSDFSTGAFPAEYGNALSGVFDLNFRHGDLENREYRFKFGLLGIDLATEGPIKKGRSSYLVNYRYSTLGILNDLGYRLLDERIDNNFQDLSFSLFFRSKDYSSNLKIFGIAGFSEELWDPIEDSVLWSRPYRTTRDYLTYMGTLGATYTKLFNENNTLFKATFAVIGSQVIDNDDTLDVRTISGIPNNTPLGNLAETRFESEDYQNSRLSAHVRLQHKVNDNLKFKAGIIASSIQFNVLHERRDEDPQRPEEFVTLIDGNGRTILVQPYVQASLRLKKLAINGGLHGMYLGLNGSGSIEPRLNLKYNITKTTAFTAAYGLHGRTLPIGNYFTQITNPDGNVSFPNRDLDIMKSHHFVAGIEQVFTSGKQPVARLSIQAYYQDLFNIPVLPDNTASFWLLNQRDGYATEALVSEGTGTNRGIDLSFQKLFTKGLFGQLSASLYQSRFNTLIPDQTFSTKYDGGYSSNLIVGKEFTLGQNKERKKKNGPGLLTIAARGFYAGGLRFSQGDPDSSRMAGRPIIPVENTFTSQLGDYFRIDLRVAYRKSFEKTAIQFSLDVQNVTNRRNDREELWDPIRNQFFIQKQSGLIPVFSLQFDF